VSIKEERVEYVGANSAQSFVLFDPSNNQGKSDHDLEKPDAMLKSNISHVPVIERSELTMTNKSNSPVAPTFHELMSERSDPNLPRRSAK